MKPKFLIVGLGNPGEKYQLTRHNIGFIALDFIAAAFSEKPEWKESQKFMSDLCEISVSGTTVLLAKPGTYMNRSAEAVTKLLTFYKIKPADHLMIISDDIDLPLGTFRLRLHGGPGTHNGLKSIVAAIGEDFPRIRIGLGNPPKGSAQDLAAWVLSKIKKDELDEMAPVLKHLPLAILERVKNLKKKK
jgi:PTH1 family peptidyl-tRNA hydrolase